MKYRILLILWLLALLPAPSYAAMALDYAAFKAVPIVHEGRVKPLDTLARQYAGRLHGAESLPNMSAIEWLARSVFSPDSLKGTPWIRITDKRLRNVLALPKQADHLYRYDQVVKAYLAQRDAVITIANKDAAALNKHERLFIDTYSALNDYTHMIHALMPFVSHAPALDDAQKDPLGLGLESYSYVDLLAHKSQLVKEASAAAKLYGKNLSRYSPRQQAASMLAFYIASVDGVALRYGGESNIFRVIPELGSDEIGQGDIAWHAPWAALQPKYAAPQTADLLKRWQQLAISYHASDSAAFTRISQEITQQSEPHRVVSNVQLSLEVWYHTLKPDGMISLCYSLAFLCLLMALYRRAGRMFQALTLAAFVSMGAGLLMHSAMIIARMWILERPPVSTLYESVIFVAWVVVALAWLMDRRSQTHESSMIGALIGAGLMLLSRVFVEPGDTLGVLVAVLNTNIWLATHVVCITIGYGVAVVAGTMGHVYLLKPSDSLCRTMHTTTLLALLFTAIGTILGGIWADQSWGRFWGWDPKENGALAIVIWLTWVLHGRLTGHFGKIGFAAWLCLTNVVVALSWFGVNLLGVGLHAYGFTEGVAWGLFLFCAVELLLTIGLAIYAKKITKE